MLGVAASAVALAGITGLCLRRATSRPHLAVGWLWYLGTLVPVIGLVQVGMQARADRYMYLPLVGLSIALAWEVARHAGASPLRARIAGGAGAVAVLLLAVVAWLQVDTWRDTRSVFERATTVTERNFLAHHVLGGALLLEGRLDEAEPHLAEALRLKPRWAAAHATMGELKVQRDDVEGAIAAFRRALELDPRSARVRARLARALASEGRVDEAMEACRRALRQETGAGAGEIHALLAGLLMNRGDLAGAVDHYERALALAPELGDARANLGLSLLRLGRVDAARAALRAARAQGADSAAVEIGLAQADERSGHAAAAIDHYRAALARDPSLVVAANNLGWILATHPDPSLRAPDEAIRVVSAAAARQRAPDPALLDTLAASYAGAGRYPEALEAARHALQLSVARGDDALAVEIRRRLALYAAGRAYVAPASTGEGRTR
jgi:tetratricopeptide (TPR) repeat protein